MLFPKLEEAFKQEERRQKILLYKKVSKYVIGYLALIIALILGIALGQYFYVHFLH